MSRFPAPLVLLTGLGGLLLGVARPGVAQHLRAAGGGAPVAALPAGSYTYVPTASLRRQTVRALARQLQATDPAAARSLLTTFGPGRADYDQLYTSLLRGSGLRDDDAASALALYLEASYRIVHHILDDAQITPAQERGLRAQAAGLLRPRLTSATAAARLGEALKLQCVLLVLHWQEARQDGQLTNFQAEVTRQCRLHYGLDLGQLQITSRGLVGR